MGPGAWGPAPGGGSRSGAHRMLPVVCRVKLGGSIKPLNTLGTHKASGDHFFFKVLSV